MVVDWVCLTSCRIPAVYAMAQLFLEGNGFTPPPFVPGGDGRTAFAIWSAFKERVTLSMGRIEMWGARVVAHNCLTMTAGKPPGLIEVVEAGKKKPAISKGFTYGFILAVGASM